MRFGPQRVGECRRIDFRDQRRHVVQQGFKRRQVLRHQLQTGGVFQNLILPRDALKGTQMFVDAPIVLGRSNTRKNQLLALFGNSIEIDERPDRSKQQRQSDQPEADQYQSV